MKVVDKRVVLSSKVNPLTVTATEGTVVAILKVAAKATEVVPSTKV